MTPSQETKTESTSALATPRSATHTDRGTDVPKSPIYKEKKKIRGQDYIVHYASARHRITKVRSQNAALWELMGGLSIYGLCISLPSIISFIVRLYQSYMSDPELGGGQWSLRQNYSDVVPPYMHLPFWVQMHNDTVLHFQNLTTNVLSIFHHNGEKYIETKAMSDLQFIIRISCVITLCRVLLFFCLVPRYQVPRRLAAFARCKSSHLLSSSEYSFHKKAKFNNLGTATTGNINQGSAQQTKTSTSSSITVLRKLRDKISHTIQYCRQSLAHDIKTPYEQLDATQALRLFSAPRYATAIFRFLYCSSSCLWAYYNFRHANFWSIWIGGSRTATTMNCWDLSGTLAFDGVSMLDSDFDHQNAALRYFILTQASYQIHSVMFHIFTLILMATQNGFKSEIIWSSMKSYLRPLVEHTLYFILIMVCFIFSGLRRLGAVAIFALEASSVFLQVLQICINAPQDSILRHPRTIKVVHRYIAVPTFVYYRMFVLPCIVQYSAGFESYQWIQQLERVLIPGCGKILYLGFNIMLAVTFVLNIVYLQRLFFHPACNGLNVQKKKMYRS